MASSRTRVLVTVLAVVLLGLLAIRLLFGALGFIAFPLGMGEGMWGPGAGMVGLGGGVLVFGLLMMLFWIAIIGGAAYLVYRFVLEGDGLSSGGDRAIEELRLAYARGDIDDDEFEERRRRLREDR